MGFKLKILDSYPQGKVDEILSRAEFCELFPTATAFLKQNRNTQECFIWDPIEKKLGIKHTRSGILPVIYDLPKEYMKLERQKKEGILSAHALSKAFDKNIPIMDLTGGFLGDTLLLSLLYPKLITFEKNIALNALILEELQLQKFPFEFYPMEATLEKITELASGQAVQLYFDPMYEEKNESAQTSGEMQFLRDRAEIENDNAKFLDRLRSLPFVKKVVVKRSIKAKSLNDNVHHSYKGKSTVFDVY